MRADGRVGWREWPERASLPLSKPGRSRSERPVRSQVPRSSRSRRAPPRPQPAREPAPPGSQPAARAPDPAPPPGGREWRAGRRERGARGCAAPPPLRAGGGTERPGGRERKPDRPAAEQLHATGGRPGQPGLGLVPFLGGSLTASADGPEAAAVSWQAEGCLPRPPARRGPRMRGGDARGQGRALSPGAAAAGRALCPWGPGARQLPGFHLPPAGPRQTPAPRPR